MSKDYNHSMKNAVRLQDWSKVEELFNEVTHLAGLQDAETEQAQRDFGKHAAEVMNAKGKQGKPI
jgi:uncharacterized protein YecA (UPF0149 family)